MNSNSCSLQRMSLHIACLLKALFSFETSGTVTQGTATIPRTYSCHPGVVCFAIEVFGELEHHNTAVWDVA